MKIRAKIKINGIRPGEELEVKGDYGRALIRRRLAEEVKADKRQPKPEGGDQ